MLLADGVDVADGVNVAAVDRSAFRGGSWDGNDGGTADGNGTCGAAQVAGTIGRLLVVAPKTTRTTAAGGGGNAARWTVTGCCDYCYCCWHKKRCGHRPSWG